MNARQFDEDVCIQITNTRSYILEKFSSSQKRPREKKRNRRNHHYNLVCRNKRNERVRNIKQSEETGENENGF